MSCWQQTHLHSLCLGSDTSSLAVSLWNYNLLVSWLRQGVLLSAVLLRQKRLGGMQPDTSRSSNLWQSLQQN